MFNNAKFLLSASEKKFFPTIKAKNGTLLPEVAFVGKSNVGKSSLLNHLTQTRKLAHTSSKPGKTRLVNFFNADDIVLVDLPGYGFAKVSKKMRSDWGELTEKYLTDRIQLKLILHLIDARHPPSKDDLAFAAWASHFKKPFLTIFTKTDKLSSNFLHRECIKNFALLTQALGDDLSGFFPYSVKDARTRAQLTKEIKQRI